LSIAAASILAKTYRDDHMDELHLQFPHYEWCSNRAYATAKHREALQIHGPSAHHRKSFRLVYDDLELLDSAAPSLKLRRHAIEITYTQYPDYLF
jgi:ribonuclease HII